jgi:hypothetical protein
MREIRQWGMRMVAREIRQVFLFRQDYLGEGQKTVQQLHGSNKHLLTHLMKGSKGMQP